MCMGAAVGTKFFQRYDLECSERNTLCGVEQWSARRAHNPKVASPNLAPATSTNV